MINNDDFKSLSNEEFNKQTYQVINDFLESGKDFNSELSGHIQATIAQFLLNTRVSLRQKYESKKFITSIDLIDTQVQELRRCIVDLERCKMNIVHGESIQ